MLASDTIVAIATARGHAAVGIVRLSGPDAFAIAARIWVRHPASARLPVFKPGRIHHGWIMTPAAAGGRRLIDEVILLPFQGPHSYTGEDVVEIQGHGGEAVLNAILHLCLQQGARMAMPGEFTKRAFLAGKLDLTQAESVMDLISAGSERALSQAAGNLHAQTLTRLLDTLRETLIDVQMQIVASVDFPDEVDEPDRLPLIDQLTALQLQANALKMSSDHQHQLNEGVRVAILGLPNSGKSSLFNALLASDRAIVTDMAGTTRDVLSERLQINGVPVLLIDTAGIRETENRVEILGIHRSWEAAETAQGVLYVVDATQGLSAADQQVLNRLDTTRVPVVQVWNKVDQTSDHDCPPEGLAVSALGGHGLPRVFGVLSDWVTALSEAPEQTEAAFTGLALNQRQVACLESLSEHLTLAAESLSQQSLPLDVTTVPLSDALHALDRLSGRDATEHVLDAVFSRFCVGK
ncbi:MAG: tRNA uridine-5-carboxymethylaminomethyl(34) synthesis GTPase MnmE [Candidatus Melainabacteria bacterium]